MATYLEAAQRWHGLAVDLAHERDAPPAALLIFEALTAHFEALPDLGPRLRADMEACRVIIEARAFQELLEREAAAKRQAEELEVARKREEQERELVAKEQEASELEGVLRKAITQAEHGRHVLYRVLAGLQPAAGGPKEVADLRSAFLLAAARLPDERAWVLVRGFTLRLRDDYAMPVAALSLTAMMLVSARATPGKISPKLLDQLEDDWNNLRSHSLRGQFSTSRIVVTFGAAVALALLGLVAILPNHPTSEAAAVSQPANQVSAPLVPEIPPSQPPADNPSPAASQQSDERPAVDIPATAFDQGLADRREWERWFAGLTGPYRAGAEWWASVRSLKSRPDCISMRQLDGSDFIDGCIEAQRRLTPSDHRRLAEPDYRTGWNSF